MTTPPIPITLAERPQYRGLPVPFIAVVAEGIPRFAMNDVNKVREAVRLRLCALCGQRLDRVYAFIGDDGTLEDQTFAEPPAHPGCAKYALSTCPHLVSGFVRQCPINLPPRSVQLIHGYEGLPVNGVFMLVLTRDFELVEDPGLTTQFRVTNPLRSSYYFGGQERTAQEVVRFTVQQVTGQEYFELEDMPLDEALGYAFTLMYEAGIKDPEDVLRQHCILA